VRRATPTDGACRKLDGDDQEATMTFNTAQPPHTTDALLTTSSGRPSRLETLLFWFGSAAWVLLFLIVTRLRVPLPEDLLGPRSGIPFDLVAQISCIAAVNFTALLPAFVRRIVRGNRFARIVWWVSIAAAVVIDTILLSTLVRLAISKPYFPP
jgi:hypothetical protein